MLALADGTAPSCPFRPQHWQLRQNFNSGLGHHRRPAECVTRGGFQKMPLRCFFRLRPSSLHPWLLFLALLCGLSPLINL